MADLYSTILRNNLYSQCPIGEHFRFLQIIRCDEKPYR